MTGEQEEFSKANWIVLGGLFLIAALVIFGVCRFDPFDVAGFVFLLPTMIWLSLQWLLVPTWNRIARRKVTLAIEAQSQRSEIGDGHKQVLAQSGFEDLVLEETAVSKFANDYDFDEGLVEECCASITKALESDTAFSKGKSAANFVEECKKNTTETFTKLQARLAGWFDWISPEVLSLVSFLLSVAILILAGVSLLFIARRILFLLTFVAIAFFFFGLMFSALSSARSNGKAKIPAAIVFLLFISFGWCQTTLTLQGINRVAEAYIGETKIAWTNGPSETKDPSNKLSQIGTLPFLANGEMGFKEYLEEIKVDENAVSQLSPPLTLKNSNKEFPKLNLVVPYTDDRSSVSNLDRQMGDLLIFRMALKAAISEDGLIEDIYEGQIDDQKNENAKAAAKEYLGEFYRDIRRGIPFQVVRWCNGWIQWLTIFAFWLGGFLLLRDFLLYREVSRNWRDDIIEFKNPDAVKTRRLKGRYVSTKSLAPETIREYSRDTPTKKQREDFEKDFHQILDPTAYRLRTRFSVRAMHTVCHVYAGFPDNKEDHDDPGLYNQASTLASLSAVREAWISKLENGKSMITYFAWAIPSIGFLGTVLGMGIALGKAGGMLSNDQSKQREVINAVTADLGAAFDTTLIAIAVSLVIMVFIYWVRQCEENLVYEIENDIRERVIPRFRPPKKSEGSGS